MSDTCLLIDDFASTDGKATLGTSWQGLTDQVMGGRSEMATGYREEKGAPLLFMRGAVRLENNGGFVQVRLPLSDSGSLDASAWQGIRLNVRALPGPYYIHLKTRDTQRPWAYYRASIPVRDQWRTVEIPFTEFRAKSLDAPLDLASLVSLGIVAYGERFDAEIELARVEFYQVPSLD